MERESADNRVDIQPEFQNGNVEPYNMVSNCDNGNFTTKLNETTLSEPSAVVNLTKKRSRRRPRIRKPGNRKRKSHKLRNRSTVGRKIIPRASLGAPFLCNDMLMAQDGFVFDTCSGKIEFKPDIVLRHSKNPLLCDEPGRMSPQNPFQCRYVPISPDHEYQSLIDLDCNANVPVMNTDDETCLDLNNNNVEIQSPLQDRVHVSPTLPFEPDTPDSDLFGLNMGFKDEPEMSLYFDDEKDFQFHLQNFEEDTDRYLRNSLMELSRESLEAEYYSTMKRLRSLQSHSVGEDMLPTAELKSPTNFQSNIPLTDQLKQLGQLANSVSSQLEKLQQENNHLKEENYQLQIALDT